MKQAYPSDLTPEHFELLRPLIPLAKPGGRPRSQAFFDLVSDILLPDPTFPDPLLPNFALA